MAETLLKRDSSTGIFLKILRNFSNCLQNTFVWLLLLIAWFQPKFYSVITLFPFFLHFILLLPIIAIMGVYSERVKKCIFFSFLTIIYPKININVVKTISPRQQFAHAHRENTSDWERFPFGKSLGVLRRIFRAVTSAIKKQKRSLIHSSISD